MAGFVYLTDPDGAPVLYTSVPVSGAAGGVLSGTYPNPGMAVGAAATNLGAAGGDLTGTYPNPTVTNLSNVTNSSLATSGITQHAVGIKRADFTASVDFFSNVNLASGWNSITTNADCTFTVGKTNSLIVISCMGGPQILTSVGSSWLSGGYTFDTTGTTGALVCGTAGLAGSFIFILSFASTIVVNNLVSGSHTFSPRIWANGGTSNGVYWRPSFEPFFEGWRVIVYEVMV